MRWKWQLLKLSSIWVFTMGMIISASLFIGVAVDMKVLGRNDFFILSIFAAWTFLLAFIHYIFVKSSRQLLSSTTDLQSFRIRAMLVALLLNLLLLAGWVFVGFVILQAFSEAEPGAKPAMLMQIFAYLLLLSVVIAVGNYLLAINAYFELQHVRRKQQEDILHAIGNPHFQHHS